MRVDRSVANESEPPLRGGWIAGWRDAVSSPAPDLLDDRRHDFRIRGWRRAGRAPTAESRTTSPISAAGSTRSGSAPRQCAPTPSGEGSIGTSLPSPSMARRHSVGQTAASVAEGQERAVIALVGRDDAVGDRVYNSALQLPLGKGRGRTVTPFKTIRARAEQRKGGAEGARAAAAAEARTPPRC